MTLSVYVRNRIIQALITVFVILSVSFFLFRVLPGDPLALSYDPRLTPEMKEKLRVIFGLDRPLYLQYFYYLSSVFTGKWGISFFYRTEVTNIVTERVWNTVFLLGPAVLISTLVGTLLGLVAGWKQGRPLDIVISGGSLLLYAFPSFWISYILIAVLAVYIPLFPTSGMATYGVSFDFFGQIQDILSHMSLPVLALTFWYSAQYCLVMRSSVIDVMSEDYILPAKAKGLSSRSILTRHVMKNAFLPTMSIIGINVGGIIAGAVGVEIMFAWPGLGRLVYDSVLNRDYPVLQATFIIWSVAAVIANFLADIFYAYLDPRIKY